MKELNLHKKFFGAQDEYFSKHPEYYTYASNFINESEGSLSYGKIECEVTGKNNFTMTLYKKTDNNIYFNLLELKIYNPSYLHYDDIFESIRIEIGGQIIDSIDDSTYINVYNQVFKTNREIRQEDDYMYIPLPFIPKEALLYTLEVHDIKILARLNLTYVRDLKGEYHTLQPELYANKYIIKESDSKVKNMIIYQSQFCGKEIFGPEMVHKMRLCFNHSVYLMYIAGNFDQSNVEKYVLKFNGEKVLEITPEELNKKNNELGYKFEYPTFLFSDIFEGYSDSTVNFSRIDKASVYIYHKSTSKHLEYIEYKVFALSLQALLIANEMAGMRFSK